MNDWYDRAHQRLMDELETMCGTEAYSFLVNIGMIDYDIEKEVLIDRYEEEED